MKWVLLDEIVNCVPDQWFVWRMYFSPSQDFFEGQFPGFLGVSEALCVKIDRRRLREGAAATAG
jgi:hypothetical protein